MYLNHKEEKIIGKFFEISDEFENLTLILKWNEYSQITAIYDSYIEDESDCDMDDVQYEEFWSFVFKAIDVFGVPPVCITEDNCFLINYHNFPDEIIADGKKIN